MCGCARVCAWENCAHPTLRLTVITYTVLWGHILKPKIELKGILRKGRACTTFTGKQGQTGKQVNPEIIDSTPLNPTH